MSDTPQDIREAVASPEDDGERLDRWMVATWPDLSRTRHKALVDSGHLSADGSTLSDPSAKVRAGITYRLDVPPPREATPEPEDIPLDILFEDDSLIVINKAAGMTVHPAAGNWTGTLVHALLHHCKGTLSGIGGVERPGIVHRLDKDTSGVMVAAKSDQAHQFLQKQFARHSVERAYLAFTRHGPKPREGRIETQLGRSGHDRKKVAVLEEGSTSGKHAITNYKVLEGYGQAPGKSVGTVIASLVECRLETGRTHQIRVHMAHIGCPLLGDPLYGRSRTPALATPEATAAIKGFQRQALHAAILGFDHPVSKERLRFETEMPEDMQRLKGYLKSL